ncbi:MAG TPA: hypothetical protein VFZ77_01265 [Acidimicrobiales bacterium]
MRGTVPVRWPTSPAGRRAAGTYDYGQVLCDGQIGMLQWSARSADVDIHDGADSYVVRDGLIVAQTIHYSVR